jgi:hypothetical protein
MHIISHYNNLKPISKLQEGCPALKKGFSRQESFAIFAGAGWHPSCTNGVLELTHLGHFHKRTETMGQIEPSDFNLPTKRPLRQRSSLIQIQPVTLLASLSGLLVLAAYVWLISFGLWTKWQNTTTYYDQLATSFSHGNLALEAKPDPALLALANPYDPSARAGLQVPTDISFYKGKFYLYFGPIPALILMIARVFVRGSIGDQYLVFSFVSGIFIFQSLLIVKLWQRFFQDISPWLIPPSIFLIGLICPIGWILSLPTVYNAAITGGAFFFLSGFFLAFNALDRTSISKWRLVLAGILWTGALGSRITQILPIGFMTIMVTVLIVSKYRRMNLFSKSIPAVLALGLTLGIGLAALSWYNWERFGSIFETGITYQLAGPYLQKYHQDLFSPVYILQNLYNYLFIPPKIKSAFPFLIPIYGNTNPIISFLPLPEIYYSQEIAGYLISAPFVLFAIIPSLNLVARFQRVPNTIMSEEDQHEFTWLTTSLLGAFLFGFAFFLVFFWVAMRYFLDFIPPLVLLSIIGFWQLYRYFADRPVSKAVYIVFGIGLIILSITASNLLALSINSGQFRQSNPLLWRQLVNFFRR